MKSAMNNPDSSVSIARSQSSPVVGFASEYTSTSSVAQHELFKTLSFKNPPPRPDNTHSTGNGMTVDMRPNLHRTFREIPFDIRERVVDLVTKAEQTADDAKRSQLLMNKQLLNLRRDYYQTDKEVSIQLKKRDLYLNQINLNSEKLGALEDDAESRRIRALKNREAISRLSRTNKNLVDAFSKLYDDGTSGENNDDNSDGLNKTKQKKNGSKKNRGRRSHIGISIDEQTSQMSPTPPSPNLNDTKNQEPVIATSNEKLRERLLQVAKEHNRVVKNVEVLEIKVEGLRSSVRFADRRNRQIKHELDELRESASMDGSSTVQLEEVKPAKEEVTKKPKSQRAATTSRLHNLLANSDFDAMDGIRHFDALLQHIMASPTNLSEKAVATHLCNRYFYSLLGILDFYIVL
jgi:hypothetical protein